MDAVNPAMAKVVLPFSDTLALFHQLFINFIHWIIGI